MADVLSINGSTIDPVATNLSLDRLIPYSKGGIPELHFTRLLGPLTTLPDPWSEKPVTLTMSAFGASAVFAGDVKGYVDHWIDGLGWAREYRALGLRWRAAAIPVTDAETLTDTSIWNLPGDDPNFIGSRAGQTVGQIVGAILVMGDNATRLSAAGIGAYTSSSPWTLPTATTNDLATLTIIPPWRVTVQGERLLDALEQLVTTCHPNHFLHVQPDGTIRFLDVRTFAGNTITIGADPRVGMPTLTRDTSENYSQVLIRGNTLVRGMTLQDRPWSGSSAADGGLAEDFAWGSYTDAQAKANWLPTDWSQPNGGIGAPMAKGACTCPDTTHVSITTSLTLSANQLAQGAGEYEAVVLLFADSLGGSVSQLFQARVIANTATSGGSCTITLDIALPSLSYNAYQLFGLDYQANAVGRRYKVTNAAIAGALMTQFPYPVPYVAATGEAASLTSAPMGVVMYSATGGTTPPYNMTSLGITIDPVGGLIYFDMPVQVAAYGLNTPVKWPAIVQVFVPVAVGTLEAFAPSASTYAGTLYTVEGVQRTKIITVLEWKDYSNNTNMATYASEYLDSVKDVIVEGSLPYNGLLASYLTPGQAVSIAGSAGGTPYTTGWESLALPVVSVDVAFQQGPSGTSYLTTLHLSNRRGRYDAGNFLRPSMTGLTLGADTGVEGGFGTSNAKAREQSAQLAQQSRDMTKEGTKQEAGKVYQSGTTEGQKAEDEDRKRRAEQQAKYREKYESDPEFRKQEDGRREQERRRQASMTPWDHAAQGLDRMYGGAAQGLDRMYGGAAQGLDQMYGGGAAGGQGGGDGLG